MNIPSFEVELKILQQRQKQRIDLSFACLELSFRLDSIDTAKRLNEREAVVHATHFEQFTQFLCPAFGERRNAGEGLPHEPRLTNAPTLRLYDNDGRFRPHYEPATDNRTPCVS